MPGRGPPAELTRMIGELPDGYRLVLNMFVFEQKSHKETGEPPLGRAKKWAWDAEKKEVVDKSLVDNKTVFPLELNTIEILKWSNLQQNKGWEVKNND